MQQNSRERLILISTLIISIVNAVFSLLISIDTFKNVLSASVLSAISNGMKESALVTSITIIAYAFINLGFLKVVEKVISKYYNQFKIGVMGLFAIFILAKSFLIGTTSEISGFSKLSLIAFIIMVCIVFEIVLYNSTVTQTTFMPTITKGRKLLVIVLGIIMLEVLLAVFWVFCVLTGIDFLELLNNKSNQLTT